MAARVRRPPFRLARMGYRWQRGATRVLTYPVRWLPEGSATKARVRAGILRFQHSLPTELVVGRGDVVVQVGTPHPSTLLRFHRALGDTGRLVIVEAMPENQERLAQAISAHRLDNVDLVRAAACDENREGELAVSPFRGDHRIPL